MFEVCLYLLFSIYLSSEQFASQLFKIINREKYCCVFVGASVPGTGRPPAVRLNGHNQALPSFKYQNSLFTRG